MTFPEMWSARSGSPLFLSCQLLLLAADDDDQEGKEAIKKNEVGIGFDC